MDKEFAEIQDKIFADTRKACEKRGLTLELTILRLKQALNAKEQKAQWNSEDGRWEYSDKMVAHNPRLKAIDLSLRVLDAYPSEKHDVTHHGNLSVAQAAAKALAEERAKDGGDSDGD